MFYSSLWCDCGIAISWLGLRYLEEHVWVKGGYSGEGTKQNLAANCWENLLGVSICQLRGVLCTSQTKQRKGEELWEEERGKNGCSAAFQYSLATFFQISTWCFSYPCASRSWRSILSLWKVAALVAALFFLQYLYIALGKSVINNYTNSWMDLDLWIQNDLCMLLSFSIWQLKQCVLPREVSGPLEVKLFLLCVLVRVCRYE